MDCPSDCPEEPEGTTTTTRPTTATTAVPSFGTICGDDECEGSEDILNCPEDCLEKEVEGNVTPPEPSLGVLTGFASALGNMDAYGWHNLLLILLILLAILRYLALPRIM